MTTTDLPGARPALLYWLAVVAVSLGTFSVVTTEMLPVGLLTTIGGDLRASDGVAGLAMTICGLVGAVSAPAVTLVAGRVDRRLLLGALMAVLALANLLAAVAPNIVVLLLSRVLVGITLGGFWAIAAGLAPRLVPERSVPRATSMVFSGVAVASVIGVPVGTVIGDAADWRVAFVVMGVVCLSVVAALALLLPPLPAERPVRLEQLGGLLRRSAPVRVGLVSLLFLVTGQFAAYTYVRPVLEKVSGMDESLVGVLLLGYGVAGIVGTFAAGALGMRWLNRTLLAAVLMTCASVILIPVAGHARPVVVGLLLLWGVAYGCVPVCLQMWMLRAAPQAPEAGSALFVTTFQVGIAAGASLGGVVADSVATSAVMWAGGGFALVTAVLIVVFRPRSERPAPEAARVSATAGRP
ncbi:MFS transporter [Spirillospora sp. CA-294931]|uniref:MFS transporter n=1 Tax=Spirillospora sp. CA-294931 TaxID=3240042 RepID=UPI003D8F6894